MRKIILIFFLNACSLLVFSQSKTIICGTVKSNQSFIVHVFESVNGYNNMSFVDTTSVNSVLINGKDSIYKVLKIEQPLFVKISFLNSKKSFINRLDVLLCPGDSLNLHFDLSISNSDWVRYSGANAEGQKLFNEINYTPYPKFIPVFDALGRLPANKNTFVAEIDKAVAENSQRFDSLRNVHSVSEQFAHSMELCFRMLFYDQVIFKFINDYKQREVLTKTDRDDILSLLVGRLSPYNSQLKGLYNSTLYLNNYFDYLTYQRDHLDNVKNIEGSEREYNTRGHVFTINKDIASATYIADPKWQADIWALKLLQYMPILRGNYTIEDINTYCAIFPGTKWEKFLRKQFSDYPPPTDSYLLQSPIRFINSTTTFSNLNELLKELPKHKPVFVDCWATWCGPCIRAFAYNKQLDSFLVANNIERLYISIDSKNNNKKWKNDVNKYCLGGYHLIADAGLLTDIKRVCGILNPEKSPILIPRYLLIDKKGAIVLNDAISPREFMQLKKQISESLAAN